MTAAAKIRLTLADAYLCDVRGWTELGDVLRAHAHHLALALLEAVTSACAAWSAGSAR